VGNYILSIGSKVIVLCVLSCADLSVRECEAASLGHCHGTSVEASRQPEGVDCNSNFDLPGVIVVSEAYC